MIKRTKGISPKVLAPVFTSLSAVVSSTIITGELDRVELAVLATAAIAALAAYIMPPGETETDYDA